MKVGDVSQLVKTQFGFHIIEILGQKGTSKEVNVAALATLDSKGTMVAVYRGKSQINLYELRDGSSFHKKNTFNLGQSVNSPDFSDYDSQRDQIEKLRFIGGETPTHLRVYLRINGKAYISDVKLTSGAADFRAQERYQD